MKEVGIGLLGVGWMGEVHATSYRRAAVHFPDWDGRARLVIAADEVEARARVATERLGFESSTTDWREVIAHPDVEAVSITSPNFMHREMALAAAAAGKHFWGEKPLGRSPAETLEIAAAAEGVRTIVGFNYRHVPAVRHARELLASGALGRPQHFRTQWVAGYSKNPRGALSWRFSRELAGSGVLADLMSHAVDLAQFLLGPIVRVTSTADTLIRQRPKPVPGVGTHFSVVEGGELGEVENEDWVAALVEFESGLKGTMEASRVAVGPEARYQFELNGTEGAVAWNFERMNELEVHGPVVGGDSGYALVQMGPQHPDFARFQPGPGIGMGYDDLKVIEAALFLRSVAEGAQLEPGVREIAAAARVLDGMERSWASGAWEAVEH